MRRWFSPLSWSLLMLAAFSGCHASWPQIFSPGTVQQQRVRATIHDPYADNTAGPPIDRPRDFDRPPSDPVRSQSLWERMRGG